MSRHSNELPRPLSVCLYVLSCGPYAGSVTVPAVVLDRSSPVPLYFQFDKTRPGQFGWQYLESGPSRWHVRIKRVAAGVANGTSSGCGGGGGGCACSGG